MSQSARKPGFLVHRWYRYSVQALLALILVISLPLGWIGRDYFRSQQEQQVVELIYQHGGRVVYDYQLQGENIVYETDPPGNEMLRQWFGDLLYARVVVVALTSDGANELIPQLSRLGYLRDLTLPQFSLDDRAAESIARFGRLHYLTLANTRVTPEQMQRIAQTKHLKRLKLYGDQFTDAHLAGIASCRYLQRIEIDGATVSDAGLRQVAKVSTLRSIRLSQLPQVSDQGITTLCTLPQLEALFLTSLPLTDRCLPAIARLKRLQRLAIRDASSMPQITDQGVAHLAALRQLESLELTPCPLHDDSLATIGSLRNLRRVDLAGSQITDAGLRHLRELDSLHSLDIAQTNVTDAGLSSLAAIPSLEFLEVSLDRGITVAGLRKVGFRTNSIQHSLFYRQKPSVGH
ncbi:leucine-rich repeat domain-containing protein [Blastopirellula marina]|nr:hypothetical protein [Blastopirellula marina]